MEINFEMLESRERRRRVGLLKEKEDGTKFEIENFEQKKCSYLQLGNIEYKQKEYTCSSCDPNRLDKICKDCYETCHKNCKKIKMTEVKMSSFICVCGRDDKHDITEVKRYAELTPCNFNQVDKRIGNFKIYKCGDENVKLCSICFYECHEGCNSRTKVEVTEEEMEKLVCECQHENHTAMNEFTFDLNLNDYCQDVKYIFPIQILNVLLDSDKTYDSLVSYIQKNMSDKKQEVKFWNIIALLTGTFNAEFKTFYYHPKILNMFPYEEFSEYSINLKSKSPEQSLLKMRSMYILYFVHVKKDFQIVKSLTVSDFMNSNILERILYKKHILTIPELIVKYKINSKKKEKEKDMSLMFITLKIAKLIVESSKKLSLLEHPNEFFLCLKFILFNLKKMLFDLDNLKVLIKRLSKFNEVLIDLIDDDGEDAQSENREKIKIIIPIFSTLVKIYYIIGITYNDLIFEQYLNEGNLLSENEVKRDFIQTFHGSSAELFKCIIKNCMIVSHYYEKVDSEDEDQVEIVMKTKTIKFFNESLKLFCMADNSYYLQLEKLNELDLKIYNEKSDQIEQLKNNFLKHKESDLHIAEVVKEFKSKIENIMDDFFTYKNIKNVNERLIDCLREFSNLSLNQNILTGHNYTHNDEMLQTNSYRQLADIDEKNKFVIIYNEKIIKFVKDKLPFVLKENFLENIDNYVDELIFSYVDETLSKFLIFFCGALNRSENNFIDLEIDYVLSFYSLFCFNKAGLKYFLYGENVKRIMTIFEAFPMKILKFFYLICKGINIYKIDITNHDILIIFKKEFFNYIETKSQFIAFKDEEEYKNESTIMLKILSSVSGYFDNESLDEMKKALINRIRKLKNPNLNLFNKENLIRISSVNLNESDQNLKKFYFAFFKIINKDTYYFFKEKEDLEILRDFYKLIDINLIKNLLSFDQKSDNLNLSFKHRVILLELVRNYYFIDVLSRDDFFKKKTYLTNEEYILILNMENGYKSSLVLTDIKIELSEDYNVPLKPIHSNEYFNYAICEDSDIMTKYNFMLELQKVISLFIQEINNLDEIITVGKIKSTSSFLEILKMENYVKKIVLSVKFICDFFFLEKNMWNNMTLHFYKLAKTFISKSNQYKQILKEILKKKNNHKNSHHQENPIQNNLIEAPQPNELLEDSNFNIFDTIKIYDIILKTFTEIFNETNLDAEFKLSTHLEKYDRIVELNFTPFEFFETKDYEHFYEKEDNHKNEHHSHNSKKEDKLKVIKDSFNNQFIFIKLTSFWKVITSISNEANLVNNIVNYFLKYIQSDSKLRTQSQSYSLLCIITKMLFYDTKQTQERLVSLDTEFFQNLKSTIEEISVLNFSLSKNFFNVKRYVEIANMNKLFIQFTQLLSEGFNTSFHPKIFGENEREDEFEERTFSTNTIFEINMNNLMYSYSLMNLDYYASGHLPYDNLIVVVSNIVSFLVEYISSSKDPKILEIINKHIEHLFIFKINKFLLSKIKLESNEENIEKFKERNNIYAYIKINLMNLFISYIQAQKSKEKILSICKKYNYNPIVLFEELCSNFDDIIDIDLKKLSKTDPDKFIYEVIEKYVEDENFRENLKMKLCFKIYICIKILSDVFGLKSIKQHFEKFDPKNNHEHEVGLFSKFSLGVYKIFERIISKVEINYYDEEKYESENQITLFVRPAFTFHLTPQTKQSFLANVNRDSQSSKLINLIEETDFFIFEMVCNQHLEHTTAFYHSFVEKLNFNYIERLNYICILLHQALLIWYFYKPTSLPNDEYSKISQEDFNGVKLANLIVGLVQLFFLVFFLIIWIFYKFPFYYQHNIMQILQKNFVFQNDDNPDGSDDNVMKSKVKKFFSNPDIKPIKIIRDLNENLPNWSKFKIAFVDSILFNREINILVFTLFFLVLFLAIGNPIIMAIPALFIANLTPILFDIFVAIRLRFLQLSLVLIFIFIFIYIYVWISMIWVPELYIKSETISPKTGFEKADESYCSSTIQCIFYMIDFGLRGENLNGFPSVSYKNTQGYFFGKFFYTIFFYVSVIMVLSNIFLGIIVDTFADLRDKNQLIEDDKNHVCYMCGITRDKSLKKRIDFETHKIDHSMWNYVYFLTYLCINDSKNFNGLENSVWEKLNKKDISWVPIYCDDGDEE